MNGADAMVKCLAAEGVEYVFGYPGVAICPFYNSILQTDIHTVLIRQEQCAAHAASGYDRISGKVGVAVVIYILLEKTIFGFELRAVGHNRHASRYAGISEKKAIITSMAIAGALSGIAGATMYLAPASGMHMHVEEVLAAQGFNGIAVALLRLSNPIGIIFTGLFVAHITVGGSYLQSLRYMKEIIDVIIGLIIYFSAFSLLMRDVLRNIRKKQKHAEPEVQGKEEQPV